uniref:Uncharacterized protein n=1 Tax=Pipistrellus kuhlii TaxID=59472 RepID=A0A7J8B2H9_PIPKU|nr:hypothetical protein mPipKuh1_007899 [Pipistrellus kuhlii]
MRGEMPCRGLRPGLTRVAPATALCLLGWGQALLCVVSMRQPALSSSLPVCYVSTLACPQSQTPHGSWGWDSMQFPPTHLCVLLSGCDAQLISISPVYIIYIEIWFSSLPFFLCVSPFPQGPRYSENGILFQYVL